MTLLIVCVIVFVVVCLAGFAVWVGAILRAGSIADDLTERQVAELIRPAGNIVVHHGEKD